jgi:hypothetical protein
MYGPVGVSILPIAYQNASTMRTLTTRLVPTSMIGPTGIACNRINKALCFIWLGRSSWLNHSEIHAISAIIQIVSQSMSASSVVLTWRRFDRAIRSDFAKENR